MDGFGGFLFLFILFVFGIKWALVKKAGGELIFRNSFDSGCGNYGRRRHRFFSEDDSFVNSDNGFTSTGHFRDHTVNPANGLPMVNGFGSVDVMGNTYGSDFNDHFGSHGFGDSSLFSSDSGLSDSFNFGSGSGISDL